MRKLLLFLVCSVSLSAQKTEFIKLLKQVKDPKKMYGKFLVIDQRDVPEIGLVTFNKEKVAVAFENNAEKDISDWLYKDNPTEAKGEFVFQLEKLTVDEEITEKSSVTKLEIKGSSFLKTSDGYHFLNRIDTMAAISSRNTPNRPQSIAKKTDFILGSFIKKSFERKPWQIPLAENELKNYETFLPERAEIFKTEIPKDGIYKDYQSLAAQTTAPGFVMEFDKKGVATKAVNGEQKLRLYEIYAFVHNGVPFKTIPVGYVEIMRDREGLFIQVKREELYPDSSPGFIMIGGGLGGLIGSAVANIAIVAVDRSMAKKRQALPGETVSLDPLTGNYIIPEDFGNTKKK
ncbi:hypothetical protein ASG01_05250 [Chryseobacterium sp. Leaf180]|uniref:hypothetical protein n=1 Tax=Chryseobacterium sp. Leaf180 TaxID=1736289 RepID=UPI0006FED81C|nr:hypothetical protein [Chryseobacterium sp. Leaf180]KQR95256.1 hypothetical protein ASG01_05250 [Chryseobacterium sp. Leaf180]